MRSTHRRIVVLLVFVALTVLPLMASAQDAAGVVGVWEGFSSNGNYVVIDITAADDGNLAATTSVFDGGIGGEVQTDFYELAVSDVDAGHTQFDIDGELGTLHGFWYGADGLRLEIDQSTHVVLTRVTDPTHSISVTFAVSSPAADDPAPNE